MKKFLLIICIGLLSVFQLQAQCTFESLFPLKWLGGKHAITETYSTSPFFQKANDTIRGTAFETGLDYLFTARNMDLFFYAYRNKSPHPCFALGDVVLNCVANDSGLVAYNYQVTYPASRRTEFYAVVDSLQNMMKSKFTYNSSVKNTTKATGPGGEMLTGEGVCVYFNNEPVVTTNLTYPQFVIRAGYLAKKSTAPKDSKVIINSAEEVEYYRLEILYKRPQPKW